MGLFSKNKNIGNNLNAFIGDKTEYKGRLDFSGAVRIDGRFEGEIISDGRLILGRNAEVEGVVRVGELMCNGKVTGDVFVTENTTLLKHSVVTGTVSTSKLSIEEGAVIEGGISMSGNFAAPAAPEKSTEDVTNESETTLDS